MQVILVGFMLKNITYRQYAQRVNFKLTVRWVAYGLYVGNTQS